MDVMPGARNRSEHPKVVEFKNGLNQVSSERYAFTIVSAWRENYNAHSFTITTIYTYLPGGSNKDLFQVVPVFLRNATDPDNPHESHELVASGGADCMLKDFRLVTPKGANTMVLIVANRDFGDSYADT
jgi:hypothetical protein